MIADAPARLLAALAEKPSRATPSCIRREPPRERLLAALDQLSERRVLTYTDRVGYGLADGRKGAAYRLAAFYRYDVGLSPDLAWYCLDAWNRLNAPPLEMDMLSRIHQNAGKYAQGAA